MRPARNNPAVKLTAPILVLLLAGILCMAVPQARGSGIHDAARAGDLKKVEALLKADPELVNATDSNGCTPLHYTALHGHKDVTELLLANKADVHAKNNGRMTPLHCAASAGCKDVAELLLANKADANAKDDEDCTPLELAMGGRSDTASPYPGFWLLAKDNPKGLIDGSVWKRWQKRRAKLRPWDELIALLRKHGAVEGDGSLGVGESGVSESRMFWAWMLGVVIVGGGALWLVVRRRREQSRSRESRV